MTRNSKLFLFPTEMLSSLPGYSQNLNSWKLFFTPQWVEWGTVTVKHKNTSKWLCRAKTWTYWNKDQSTNHWTTESPKLHFSVCITDKFTNSITTWCVTALPRNFVVQYIINCNPSFDLKFSLCPSLPINSTYGCYTFPLLCFVHLCNTIHQL